MKVIYSLAVLSLMLVGATALADKVDRLANGAPSVQPPIHGPVRPLPPPPPPGPPKPIPNYVKAGL